MTHHHKSLLAAVAGSVLLACLFELLAGQSWFMHGLGEPMFELAPASGIARLCYLIGGVLIGWKVREHLVVVLLVFSGCASLVHISIIVADPQFFDSNAAPLLVILIYAQIFPAAVLGMIIGRIIGLMRYPAVPDKPED